MTKELTREEMLKMAQEDALNQATEAAVTNPIVSTAIIGKEYKFEAAHQLPHHNGKCARLHGHSYVTLIELMGPVKPLTGASDEGMVVDFYVLDEIMNPLIDGFLDHKYLNDIIAVPTAEQIAGYIIRYVDSKIYKNHYRVLSVTVWETAKAYAKVMI